MNGELRPFRHANTFARAQTSGPQRLHIGPRGGHRSLMLALAWRMHPRYKVLYVLHTSRTDAALGRYESPDLGPAELEAFFRRFGDFFAQDARHDVWIGGSAPGELLVWDRHDIVYAYGPLDRFTEVLEEGGFREGWPGPPVPHLHLYNAEWDGAEREVLGAFPWRWSELRDGDVQRKGDGD